MILVIILQKKESFGETPAWPAFQKPDKKRPRVRAARSDRRAPPNRMPMEGTHMAVAFTINGKAESVDVDANTPLLWVVREHLKLTGTKFGCGSGLCGACTVHVDGKAMRSCQTTMSEVEGKKVNHIDSLAP